MTPGVPSRSLRKRLRKFRRLKRGYYSFLIVICRLRVSRSSLPLLMNSKALVVKYEGEYYFPIASYYAASDFGLTTIRRPDYRALDEQFEADGGGNWVLMPPYPYGPNESLLDLRARRRTRRRGRIPSAPTTAAATCSCAWPTASTSR